MNVFAEVANKLKCIYLRIVKFSAANIYIRICTAVVKWLSVECI